MNKKIKIKIKLLKNKMTSKTFQQQAISPIQNKDTDSASSVPEKKIVDVTPTAPKSTQNDALTSSNLIKTQSKAPTPSPLRQLLPFSLCLISFATVFTMLIIYMDTTGKSIIYLKSNDSYT